MITANPTPDLVARYDTPGPRYTSYPTAVEFHEGVGAAAYLDCLAEADAHPDDPLSMYVHLPFCEERCGYCGCFVVITRHRDVAARYLDALEQEIDLLATHLPHRRRVSQLHWGGGTPTYYQVEDLRRIADRLQRHFTLDEGAELGVEVDPRVTSPAQLDTLRAAGFNRLSMGVQDFAPDVQRAVNRVQSYEETAALLMHARQRGFRSINVDLIYGLPKQTPTGFGRTLDQVVSLRPERVAVYSFAFVPWMKAHMKALDLEAMPTPTQKIDLFLQARTAFTSAGYVAIGIDHFALPDDELALAAGRGTLHRNFMGYTAQTARDMVAVGASAIGDLQDTFVQNAKKLSEYYDALDRGCFPTARGYQLDADDRIRRCVITALMCNGRVEVGAIEARFGIRFADYFADALADLLHPGGLVDDGMVLVGGDAVQVTPLGRSFLRNVCMPFDRYLRARIAGPAPVFSRTV